MSQLWERRSVFGLAVLVSWVVLLGSEELCAQSAEPVVEKVSALESRVLDSAVLTALPLPRSGSAALEPASAAAQRSPVTTERPAPLIPLYVSFGALQVLDVHSTRRGVDVGATELNGLVRAVGVSGPGMFALKAAATAGIIHLTEKAWKKNPVAAVVVMVGANLAYAAIVSNNYRVGTSLGRVAGP